MKRHTILIIIALVFSIFLGCGDDAFAGDWFSWDEKNTELHYYVTGLMLLDMGQTLDIADNPHRFHEKYNLYLNEHPTRTEVKQYFAWSYVVSTLITWALPSDPSPPESNDEWSHLLQKGIIGLEFYISGQNAYIGIGFGI